MRRLGDILARDADQFAEVETRDTGKLLREMRGQLATIPDWFYYFAGLADSLRARQSPPISPFGGYGMSGIGRENGIDAVREYPQAKAIWVELTGCTRDPFTLG